MAERVAWTAEVGLGCYALGQKQPLPADQVVKELSQKPELMA